VGIRVECTCKHVTEATAGRAGLSVLCESCGRTLVVPTPPNMSPADVKAARQREQAERKPMGVAQAMGLWVQEHIWGQKLRSAIILVCLVLLGIAMWWLISVLTILQRDMAPRAYTGEKLRKELKMLEGVPQKAPEDVKEAPATAASKAATATDGADTASDLLGQAEKLIYDQAPQEARSILETLLENHPDAAEATKAREHLRRIEEFGANHE
jgi:rRNA maturation protein Nop10